MISKVVLAKLSPTMDEGTIVAWHKQEGDVVAVGDVLAEIETDKANMEMEALAAGVLRRILVPAGAKAPVGGLIGIIADTDEDITLAISSAQSASPPIEPTTVVLKDAQPSSAAPSRADVVKTAPPSARRVKASPLARRLAAERRVSLESLSGSGPGGRIIKRDIDALDATIVSARDMEVPLTAMRHTIARRVAESFFTAPHFYVTSELDMEAATTLRHQLAESRNVKISFNDLLIKASALALRDFPLVNASWEVDRIVTHGEIHVGVAVALPDGLLTPVVRNADHKSVIEIANEVRDLVQRARDKRLSPAEYLGSTFTVSNLGMFDVSQFTAIINSPESAILAVGAVRRVPVVSQNEILVGRRMNVTLGSDHRVVDGAIAAQFLQRLRRLIENPVGLLL